MYRRFSGVFRSLSDSVALIGLVQGSMGAQANRFAGYYELSNIVTEGSQIHLTMTLTLMNPGNSDVKNGTVAVLDSSPNPALIGSFSAIKTLPHRNQVTVSQTLTIEAAEYARWQHGHVPLLELFVQSGDTTTLERIQAHQVVKPAVPEN